MIGVNLRGAFLCSQNVARRMVERGQGGAIINMASTRAFMSEPDTEAYTASKGGIVALTHGMAISLGPHGIRVNAVSPGWIETRDWQFSARAEDAAALGARPRCNIRSAASASPKTSRRRACFSPSTPAS